MLHHTMVCGVQSGQPTVTPCFSIIRSASGTRVLSFSASMICSRSPARGHRRNDRKTDGHLPNSSGSPRYGSPLLRHGQNMAGLPIPGPAIKRRSQAQAWALALQPGGLIPRDGPQAMGRSRQGDAGAGPASTRRDRRCRARAKAEFQMISGARERHLVARGEGQRTANRPEIGPQAMDVVSGNGACALGFSNRCIHASLKPTLSIVLEAGDGAIHSHNRQ
jgi:hypothetical protein